MLTQHLFDPSILREYDIRGVVGQTLHEADAYAIGRSFGTMVQRGWKPQGDPSPVATTCLNRGGANGDGPERKRIVVGYDGRLSSEMLEAALVRGLMDSGIDVLRIGMGPTPMLYFAETSGSGKEVVGGIQVTGSHNPADHNGFKMVLGGSAFFGRDIQMLGRIAGCGDWHVGVGTDERQDVVGDWLSAMVARIAPALRHAMSGMRIGWDAGNGAAGPAIERLVAALPGEHYLLFTHVDGTFPHHHPDPSDEANLADLRALVAAKNLDFGVAFDGDADRIGAIDGQGRILAGDQLLAIFAQDFLQRAPGATIIADIKASLSLTRMVQEAGGTLLLWNAGHSHIKSKMKEAGVKLAGETTGHMFLAEDWYGFDDALYAAVALMGVLARQGQSLAALRNAMPLLHTTPEIRLAVESGRKFAVIDEVRDRLLAAGQEPVTIDGVRVAEPQGWWLLRASNTQEALSIRAESDTEAGLARMLASVDAQLAICGIIREGPGAAE